MEPVLRNCWNTKLFTQQWTASSEEKAKPFLLEETGKVTVQHLNDLMRCNYTWAVISLIYHIAAMSDQLGSWAEGCPCAEHQTFVPRMRKMPGKKRPVVYKPSSDCVYKCCRAPELAAGTAHVIQSSVMHTNKHTFLQSLYGVPESQRNELHTAFEATCGRLIGVLS